MKLSAHGSIVGSQFVDVDSRHFKPPGTSFKLLEDGRPRSLPPTGIKVLMQAVLEEAIRNYLGTNPRLRADAEWWIVSSRRCSPFAFSIVCESLGLEADAVRIALRRRRERDRPARRGFGRIRGNVRRSQRLAT